MSASVARRAHLVALGLMSLAVALQLAALAPTLARPFGASHDGVNGATWAFGSRALRRDGPVRSRLGTRAPDRSPVAYADHPPGIALAIAGPEAVAGGRRAATRLVPLLSSLALGPLLFALLRACGLAPVAAATGAIVGATSPITLQYGAMVDTWTSTLALGVALLLVDTRARSERPLGPVVSGVVAAAAVLTSWLGVLTAGLVAGRRIHHRVLSGSWGRGDRALVAATGGAAVLLAVWLLWATGPSTLVDAFRARAVSGSGGGVGAGGFLRALALGLGPAGMMGAIGVVVALRRPALRAPAALSTVVTVTWCAAFWDGATHHSYWAYWVVVPAAIGVGAIVATVEGRELLRVAVPIALCALTVAGFVAGRSDRAIDRLLADAGAVARGAPWPEDQRVALLLSENRVDLAWLAFESGRAAARLTPAEAAATPPPSEHLVLIQVPEAGAGPSCPAHVARRGRFAVVRASTLADPPGCTFGAPGAT